MRPLFTLAIVVFAAITAFAQSPQKMNYQGVARDNAGNVLANQNIGIRISLHQTFASGPVVFQETHTSATNQFGLFTIQIGNGTPVSGSVAGINWGSNSHFVQVEMDPNGGASYVDMGTSQLLSVPYALYAENSGTPGPTGPSGATGPTGPTGPTGFLSNGSSAGNTPYWNGASWVVNSSNIYNNGGNVGIGITSPQAELEIRSGALRVSSGTNSYGNIHYEGSGGGGLTLNSWENGSGTWADMSFQTNGVTRLFIESQGKMGVGTTSPSAPLHVSTNGSEIARFEGSGASHWISLYQGTSRKGILWSSMDDIVLRADEAAGDLRFQTNGNNDRLTINSAGNLGMGTVPTSSARLRITEPGTEAALIVGQVSSAHGYLTVDKPSANDDRPLARFRDDGLSLVVMFEQYDDYQLVVLGDGLATGGTWQTSDSRLKTNIQTVSGALDNILKLNPTTYYFDNKNESYKHLNLPDELQFGFLAQEIKEVFPNVVKETMIADEEGNEREDKLHTMNYTALVPVLVKGMQEQQELILELQKEIEVLKNK